MRKRLFEAGIGAIVIAIIFLHPMGKQIILFLLPLGSGYDDLLGIIALVIALVMFFSWLWTGVPTYLVKKGGPKK